MGEPKEFTKSNYEEEYKNRLENIKSNLYKGGGEAQGHAFLTELMMGMGQMPDIDPSLVLHDIGNILKIYQRLISTSGIVPIKNFYSGRPHDAYACLDNDLKFCVKHYGEDDWKDIKYVFPYMNCTTAFDVSFGYDRIFVPEF